MVAFRWISQILIRWQRLGRIQKAKQWHYRTEARPFALALEPRRVLNAAPVVPQAASAAQPAQVIVNAGKAANDGKADTFVISKSAAGDIVTVNGKPQQIIAPGEKIVIQGSSDKDIVKVDFSNGNPLSGNEIWFSGEGGGDSIQLTGAADTVIHQFTANGAGRVTVDGGSLNYSANVSVNDLLSVGQRTFELDVAESFQIGDSTTSGIDEARGQSGQDVQFAESSAVLQINSNQSTAVANQITVNSLDSSARRSLTINADASDSVIFVGIVDLNAGNLAATAGTITVSGQIQTNDANVQLLATSQLTIDSAASIVNTGGDVTADAGPTGVLWVQGTIDASNLQSGQTGGAIHLLGDKVGLAGATIDARGDAGGGQILIGGDFHGTNTSIRNASQTIVDKNSTLNASAVRSGNGGNVVVWSNLGTSFSGQIVSTGGSNGGNGGQAEVSGGELGFNGSANLSAALGTTGTLLLDPKFIIVDNAGGVPYVNNVNNKFANVPDETRTISATSIVTILNTGLANVTLQANSDITIAQDIIVDNPIGDGGDLILQAGRSIFINANITTDNGNFSATANETTANGVVNSQRDGANDGTNGEPVSDGKAVIQFASGVLVDAGTGSVNLHVSTGAGLTNNQAGTLTLGDIQAASLVARNDKADIAQLAGTTVTVDTMRLIAGGSIGTSVDRIISDVKTVAASANGNIYITVNDTNNDGVNIGAGDANADGLAGLTTTSATGVIDFIENSTAVGGGITLAEAVTAAGGGVSLRAHSPLVVNANVSDTGGGNILLVAEGNQATDDLTINANVTASGGNGNIQLFAGDTISQTAARVLSAVGTGTITARAGTDYNAGAPATGSATGALTMASNATIQTADGAITLRAQSDITVSTVNANSNNDATRGNVTITVDGTGAIKDGNAATLNITANTLDLNAKAGIGDSADALELNVRTVTAKNTTTNGIFLEQLAAGGNLAIGATGLDTSTANSNIQVTVDNGTLAVNGPINAGTGAVRLQSSGSITQTTGTITAQTMRLISTGSIGTTAQRITADVKTVAASANGNIYITVNDTNNDGVNVGAGDANADGLAGLTTTSATGVIDFIENSTAVGGGITLAEAVTAAGGGVSLRAHSPLVVNANISDTGGGNILLAAEGNTEADDLTINANVTATGGNGSIQLFAGDDITMNAGDIVSTAGTGKISAFAGIDYNAGTPVAGFATGALSMDATSKLQTSNGDITVRVQSTAAAGTKDMALGIINAGTGTVRLQSVNDITQKAAITADKLSAISTAGNVLLGTFANQVNSFAAQATAGGKSINYHDTNDFTIDEIVGNTGLNALTSVGKVTGINVGTADPASTVRLRSGGAIDQTANGAVVASVLGAEAINDIDLCEAVNGANDTTNNVTAFAFKSGTQAVFYNQASQINTTTVTKQDTLSQDLTGFDTPNFAYKTDGDLIVNTEIGLSGTLTLISNDGSVTQTQKITADKLAAQAKTFVDLYVTGNDLTKVNNVNEFAAKAGNYVYYRDADAVSITAVTGIVDCGIANTTGVQTTSGDIEIHADGNITANAVLNAPGKSVRLWSENGAIGQNANGAITSVNLSALAKNSIDLWVAAGNDVTTFAAQSDTGSIYYRDANDFAVGQIAKGTKFDGAQTGVTAKTNNQEIDLLAGGKLDLEQGVTASMTGGTIRLSANTTITQLFDSVAQPSGQKNDGFVKGDQLSALAKADIQLFVDPNNDLNTFAAKTTNGSIYYRDINNLTVGTVAGGSKYITASQWGATTKAGPNVELQVGGSLVLEQAVSTAANKGTIRLEAGTNTANSTITQKYDPTVQPDGSAKYDGFVSATNLSAFSNGMIDLCDDPNNDVENFAATSVNDSVYYHDLNSFAVDTIAGGTYLTTTRSGVTAQTDGKEIELDANGTLTLNQGVTASMTGGTIRLQGDDGIRQNYDAVAQPGGTKNDGFVKGDSVLALSSNAGGNIDLYVHPGNDVNTFAAKSALGSIFFRDVNDFTVGKVAAGTHCITTGQIGVVADAKNQQMELTAGSALTLDQGVTASMDGGTIRLDAGTSIVQNFDGKNLNGFVQGNALSAHAKNDIDLYPDPNNDVNIFAAKSETRSVYFYDKNDLTIDTVAGGKYLTADRVGVIATGSGQSIEIQAKNNLTIQDPITASRIDGTVRLQGDQSVTQTSAGVITANQLAAISDKASGIVVLCPAENQANVFAAIGNTVSFWGDQFQTGTVGKGKYVSPVDNIVNITAATEIALKASGDLDVNVVTKSTTVLLESVTGSVTQSATITSDSLVAHAAVNVDLRNPGNDTDVFAAEATSGFVYFKDLDSVTIGSVAGSAGCVAGFDGIVAGTNIEVVAASTKADPGNIRIEETVNAKNDTIRLKADDSVIQTATGNVIATKLSVNAKNAIELNHSSTNDVRQFAAYSSGKGDISLVDTGNLTITTISKGAIVNDETIGVFGGNIDIETTGANADMQVLQPVNSASNGTIKLAADRNLTVNASVGNVETKSVTLVAQNGAISRGIHTTVLASPAGDDNDLIFTDTRTSATPPYNLAIIYQNPSAPSAITTATASDVNGVFTITVTLKTGGSTANEILAVVNGLSAGVSVSIAPWNDGSGVITAATPLNFRSSVVGQTVNLAATTAIGSGTIDTMELEGVSSNRKDPLPGTAGNPLDWNLILNGNPTGIYVQTNTVHVTPATGSRIQGDVWLDVNPLKGGDETTIDTIVAGGNVVITSLDLNNNGQLNLNSILAEQRILVYTNASSAGGVSVDIGSLISGLTRSNTVAANRIHNLNAIAVDSNGSLDKLPNYQIITGNMILLQLIKDSLPLATPLNASNGADYDTITANYNFFDIEKPFPTPYPQIIRPTVFNGITSTYGTRTSVISSGATALTYTDQRSATEQQTHTITIVYRDPGAPNQTRSISTGVDDKGNQIITISLDTDAAGNVTTTTQQIADLVNGDASASALVQVTDPAAANAAAVVSATSGVIGAEHGFNISISWGDLLVGSSTETQVTRLPAGIGYSNTNSTNTLITNGANQTITRSDGSAALDTTNPITISHSYNVSSTATYLIDFTVSIDPSISLATHGLDANNNVVHTYFEKQSISIEVLNNGTPNLTVLFFPREATPLPPVVAVALVQPNTVQPLVNPTPPIVLQDASGSVPIKERFLKLFLIPEDGSDPIPVSLIQNGQPDVRLDLGILSGDRLIDEFKSLPDGRYRLELYRTLDNDILDERTILETVITNGTPSDPLEELIEQLRRTFQRELESDKKETQEPSSTGIDVIPNDVSPVTATEEEEQSVDMAAAGAFGGLFGLLTHRRRKSSSKPDDLASRPTGPANTPLA